MKQLHDRFHICDLMREEFNDCFVTSHLAKPVDDFEKVGNVLGDQVGALSSGFPDVNLEKARDWRDKLV